MVNELLRGGSRENKRHTGLAVWFTLNPVDEKNFTDLLNSRPVQQIVYSSRHDISSIVPWYSSPFKRHITLVSSITDSEEVAISKTSQLASKIPEMEFKFFDIDYDEKRQSLRLKAEVTEGLNSVYAIAHQKFELEQKPFHPHMSISYEKLDEIQFNKILYNLNLYNLTQHFYKTATVEKLQLVKPIGGRSDREWAKVAEFNLAKEKSKAYG